MPDSDEPSAYCACCGKPVDQRTKDDDPLIFCTSECQDEYELDNPGTWRPDPTYRGGYEYAAGYHD